MTAGAFLHQDREADGGEHEDDGARGCEPRQNISCSKRTDRRLRSLTAKRASKVSALALLQQDDDEEEDTNDNVERKSQVKKHARFSSGTSKDGSDVVFGAEGGT